MLTAHALPGHLPRQLRPTTPHLRQESRGCPTQPSARAPHHSAGGKEQRLKAASEVLLGSREDQPSKQPRAQGSLKDASRARRHYSSREACEGCVWEKPESQEGHRSLGPHPSPSSQRPASATMQGAGTLGSWTGRLSLCASTSPFFHPLVF